MVSKEPQCCHAKKKKKNFLEKKKKFLEKKQNGRRGSAGVRGGPHPNPNHTHFNPFIHIVQVGYFKKSGKKIKKEHTLHCVAQLP